MEILEKCDELYNEAPDEFKKIIINLSADIINIIKNNPIESIDKREIEIMLFSMYIMGSIHKSKFSKIVKESFN